MFFENYKLKNSTQVLYTEKMRNAVMECSNTAESKVVPALRHYVMEISENDKNVMAETVVTQGLQSFHYDITHITPQNDNAVHNKKCWLESFEERAAIVQYDGNLDKEVAEYKAWNEMIVLYCSKHGLGKNAQAVEQAVHYLLACGLPKIKELSGFDDLKAG